MAEVSEKGFLPKLSQFSHPDGSFWEVRGQMTILELLTSEAILLCQSTSE